jgi:Uma2 family endonuclease
VPAVDERLVMPGARYEIIDGRVVHVSPADPPHASRHSKLSALLEAYTADGYDAASDMLTRTSHTSDIAPDGSVYPTGPDEATGGRRLEELAFEIVSTQSMSLSRRKAARLADRGVRRIFAIDVERSRVLEWSRTDRRWERLADNAEIVDPVFVLPLAVSDLVHAARSDDAVARALLAKQNPVLERAGAEREQRGRALGLLEGKAQAIVAILRSRGIELSPADEARIRGTTHDPTLDTWLDRAVTCREAADLFTAERE